MFASSHLPSAPSALRQDTHQNRHASAFFVPMSIYIIILALIRIIRIMGQKICSTGREGGVPWRVQRSALR